MADQKRWFKVWTSITANGHFAEMSLEDVGRWTLLGAATALDGDDGRLEVPGRGAELCRLLRVGSKAEALRLVMRWPSIYVSEAPVRWPHGHDKAPVCNGAVWRGGRVVFGRCETPFEEWCERYDPIIVTFRNWRLYQEDSTSAARMRALRSKTRREETRRDTPPIPPSPGGGVRTAGRGTASQAQRAEGPAVNGAGPRAARTRGQASPADPAFETFYAGYPRHEGKHQALKAWRALHVSNGLSERIMGALGRHRARWHQLGTPKDKIPLPASWLNGRRWEDELPEPAPDPYVGFPRA